MVIAMSLLEPRCFSRGCANFVGVVGLEPNQHVACVAFDKSIPDEIAYGENLHLSPVPGDHGIQFQKLETKK